MISDVRSVRVGHLETLSQCAPKLSQGAPSLSQSAPKVSQGAPTFFQAYILLQHLTLANRRLQLQVYVVFKSCFKLDPRCFQVPNLASQDTPCGVSRCPSTGYIETLFSKSVLLKNVRLHISENFHLLLKYTPLDAVSVGYVSSKYIILKIKSMIRGFEFFRLKVPQSPLPQGTAWCIKCPSRSKPTGQRCSRPMHFLVAQVLNGRLYLGLPEAAK